MHVAVLALALVSASCWFRHPPRAFVPPPAKARPFVLPPAPHLPDPPELEVSSDAAMPPDIASDIPVLPPPPAPRPRPPVVATPKPVPPPVAAEPIEPVEPPAAPRLGQIFTADQLREYNRSLDESLGRVRTILAVAAGKSLTAEQTGIVSRIRTFMAQAEQARQQDLVTAVSLAKRADLLAQDLAGRLP